MKKSLISSIVLASLLLSASPVLAHVVVKPNQAGIAAFQTFTVGVPVEKDMPTTGLKLIIPDGLKYVTPNVKPGWTINVKREGEGEDAKVTEIDWTGGSIPAGQRDDFVFSAQVPSSATTVVWKAYQTSEDGTVVSWDQDPKKEHGDDESGATGPYSQTAVVNDLASDNKTSVGHEEVSKEKLPLGLSLAALGLAAAAFVMQFRNKK